MGTESIDTKSMDTSIADLIDTKSEGTDGCEAGDGHRLVGYEPRSTDGHEITADLMDAKSPIAMDTKSGPG